MPARRETDERWCKWGSCAGRTGRRAPATATGLAGAARYTGKFGDVGFGVGAGMYLYQGANDAMNSAGEANPEDMGAWLVGGYLDFGGGFRVAAAHKQVTDDNKAARGTTTDVGVRYIQGAHRFSIVGVFGEQENGDDTRSTVVGGYGRSLGPGVVVHADLFWTAAQSDETAEMAQMETDGLALLTGIKVSF